MSASAIREYSEKMQIADQYIDPFALKVLILPVGTGTGAGENIDSLTHGLNYVIDTLNPDKIILIVTKESKERTLPHLSIKNDAKKIETVEITTADNIQSIYNELKPVMERLKGKYSIHVDLTSGTKAMTTALAMLSVLYEAGRVSTVSGIRKNGIVQIGTETLSAVMPLFAVSEKKLETAVELFNNNRFEAALEIAEEAGKSGYESSLRDRVSAFTALCKAYMEWDRFNHKESFELLKKVLGEEYTGNKKFLRLLLMKQPDYDSIIADLLSNALRRGDGENKYDDAVARLYRVVELLAQVKLLRKYHIDTSNVKSKDLPEELNLRWANRFEDGVMKIALSDSYLLLRSKGDPLGSFLEDDTIRGLLTKRNDSILAHGLAPIESDSYERLRDSVLKISKTEVKELDSLLKESTFIKIPRL